jgi:uncharacterized protein YjdB/predicted heme/steroid binding protein
MKKHTIYLITLMALFMAALMSLSCAGTGDDINIIINVTGVNLDKPVITLQPTDQSLVKAEVLPANATNKAVRWGSSNLFVAMVTSDGMVTAVRAGEAVITATTEDGGIMAMCRVTVVINVTGVNLNRPDLRLGVGGIELLTATVLPTDATNQNVTWFTSHPCVTVDNGGVVRGIYPGTAYVYVITEDGGHTAGCDVTVSMADYVAAMDVMMSKNSTTISVFSSETLMANVVPANATNRGVDWTTSDSNIVSIVPTGEASCVITGASIGVATVTAISRDGGYRATCDVNVQSAVIDVEAVALEPAFMSLTVGDEKVVKPVFQPLNVTNTNVTWKSSDEYVAVVAANGTVRAVGAGTAIVTVTTDDGGFTAECEVNVASVYAAGYEEEQGVAVAKLWVDGEPRELISNGLGSYYAKSVFVSGGNVYVVGYKRVGDVSIAMLWIKGLPSSLTNGSNNAQASSVFVVGGIAYVAGYEEYLGKPAAKLWVNGSSRSISGSGNEAKANCVFVAGGVVYVAGYEVDGGTSLAKLWIDYVPTDISVNAEAASVFMSNDRMCVAGYENSPLNPQKRFAKLWINGTPETLSDVNSSSAYAASVYMSGNSVYVVGSENNVRENSVATLWKYGELGRNSLSNGSYRAGATSVYVFSGNGNVVYVAGYEMDAYGKSVAMLWKDGFARPLTSGVTSNARADSVFVK